MPSGLVGWLVLRWCGAFVCAFVSALSWVEICENKINAGFKHVCALKINRDFIFVFFELKISCVRVTRDDRAADARPGASRSQYHECETERRAPHITRAPPACFTSH